jgi:hypothetical protein
VPDIINRNQSHFESIKKFLKFVPVSRPFIVVGKKTKKTGRWERPVFYFHLSPFGCSHGSSSNLDFAIKGHPQTPHVNLFLLSQ